MIISNKTWATSLMGLALLLQASIASASVISDHELEFSSIDSLVVGESFDVDVLLDVPSSSELTTFGFDFLNALSIVSFDGFTLSESFIPDNLNDVGGIVDVFATPFFGNDSYLGTMHFTVLSSGTETISMFGELFENGGGAFFLDPLLDGSIGGSFDINVSASEVSTPSLFMLLLVSGFGLLTMRTVRK